MSNYRAMAGGSLRRRVLLMARIAIVHPILRASGGQDYLALSMASSLSIRHHTIVLTLESADPRTIAERMRIDLSGVGLVKIPLVVPSVRERLQRLSKIIGSRALLWLGRETLKECDLVIETQSNAMLPVDVCYIHYPSTLPTRPDRSLVFKAYNAIVVGLSRSLDKRACKVLTNSRWTARIIEEVYGVRPRVLYPPVDTEFFSSGGLLRGRDRVRAFVTVTRVTPEKRVEELLGLASVMRDWAFIIVGFSEPQNPYLGRLHEEKARKRLSNVFFVVNAPRDYLRRLLRMAKYYLHPPFREHFGISVVEAMAAGTPPIVYRGGGSWSDVVKPLDHRLGYKSVYEVPRIVEYAERRYTELQEKAVNVSRKFSVERFREEALNMIEGILSVR